MKMRLCSLLLVLLAVTLQCSEARTHKMHKRKADIQDDFSDGEESYDDPQADAAAEYADDAVAGDEVNSTILNQGQVIQAYSRATIRLPCQIQPSPIQDSSVDFMWSKDGEQYFLGNEYMKAPKRMFIDNITGTDLIITDFQPEDAGNYKCDLMKDEVPVYITHVLKYSSPAKIEGIYAPKTPVREGEDVQITCIVSGSPPPKIIWTREINGENVGLHEEDGTFSMDTVTIHNVTREHSGKYFCYADNKIATPDVKSVSIKIVGKPRVHVHMSKINAEMNKEAVISCTTHDLIVPTFRWLKDGRDLESLTLNYDIKKTDFSTSLTIVPTKQSDFGTYTCEAANQFGSHNRSVELVSSPVVEDLEVDGPKISWVVHSHQPLESLYIELYQITEDGPDSAQRIDVPIDVSPKNHSYSFLYQLTDSRVKPGKYKALVVAENTNGDNRGHPVDIAVDESRPEIRSASVLVPDAAGCSRISVALISTVIVAALMRLL